MTTFDLAEVREFSADIHASMNRCDTGEGSGCAALDADFRRYTELCRAFCDQVRRWGLAVFPGRVEFDPEVEGVLREDGRRLYAQIMEFWKVSQGPDTSGSDLDGQAQLRTALRDLDRLVNRWVTPKLAVGPSARRSSIPGSAATEEEINRIASLPPLPADWQLSDPRQQEPYREPRIS